MRKINRVFITILAIGLILAASLIQACSQATSPEINSYPLVPMNPAKLGTVERDITYGTADGVPLKMDIYYPEFATGAVPAVLYVHGGAWVQGDKSEGVGIKEIPELRSRGYLVAAVNYRLAPDYKFPAQIEDVKCAVRFLRANAAIYGIDPARIGAWGGSAGGHLVALLGTTDVSAGFEGDGGYTEESSRVEAVVDMFGPTDLKALSLGGDLRFMLLLFGTINRNASIVKRANPINWISSDDPPFLILHGENDELVPVSQSEIFYNGLVTGGVPATLVIVENAGHGFAPVGGVIYPSRSEITDMVADFFDKYLK